MARNGLTPWPLAGGGKDGCSPKSPDGFCSAPSSRVSSNSIAVLRRYISWRERASACSATRRAISAANSASRDCWSTASAAEASAGGLDEDPPPPLSFPQSAAPEPLADAVASCLAGAAVAVGGGDFDRLHPARVNAPIANPSSNRRSMALLRLTRSTTGAQPCARTIAIGGPDHRTIP